MAVGRNKTIFFFSSDYDHICNGRILTMKSEFALSPYFKLLSSDYGHIFFDQVRILTIYVPTRKYHSN